MIPNYIKECFSLFFIGNQSLENIILRFFEILLRKTWMFVEIVLSFWWKHKFTKSTIISQYIYLTKWCIGTFHVFTSIYHWWMFNEKYNSMEKSSIFHQMFRNIMNCRIIIFCKHSVTVNDSSKNSTYFTYILSKYYSKWDSTFIHLYFSTWNYLELLFSA